MADKKNVQVRLDNVRLSFPKIATAVKAPSGFDRWSACFYLDDRKGSPLKANVKKLNDAVKEIRDECFEGRKVESPFKKAEGSKYIPDGTLHINASAYKVPPTTVDNKRRLADPADSQMFYAGARVTVVLTLYPQMSGTKHGATVKDRINANLDIIQFAGHDERLGGNRPEPEAVLDDIEVEDTAPEGSESEVGDEDDGFDVG